MMINKDNLNVDPEEIQKFEAVANRWWDTQGEFKPLHDLNPCRIDYIKQHAGDLSGLNILDVGCGGGILSEALVKAGANVTAIDMGKANLDVAKMHLYESKLDVDYRLITVEELAEQQHHVYDVVTCLEMLEHVPDPESIIRACGRLLKPQGNLFLSTLNRHPKAYVLGVLAAEYILKLLPKGTHDYKKFIKPSELSRWVRQANCQVKAITGVSYNPFTGDSRLSAAISINYMLYACKE